MHMERSRGKFQQDNEKARAFRAVLHRVAGTIVDAWRSTGVIWGAGYNGRACKGRLGGPIRALQHYMENHGVRTWTVNEFRTTKLCACHGEVTEKVSTSVQQQEWPLRRKRKWVKRHLVERQRDSVTASAVSSPPSWREILHMKIPNSRWVACSRTTSDVSSTGNCRKLDRDMNAAVNIAWICASLRVHGHRPQAFCSAYLS